MIRKIDLNADLGEGSPNDTQLMPIITSCNIACGGHAGHHGTIRTALKLAKKYEVSAGAHPSYPDRENFGRSPYNISNAQLEKTLHEQIQTIKMIALDLGTSLTHIKPHGALYNMAAIDTGQAEILVNVLECLMPGTALVGPPYSEMHKISIAHGITYHAEGFADRAYETNGQLRDRSKPGAIIEKPSAQAEQAISLAKNKCVTSFSGVVIDQPVETICIHGDSPNAVAAARTVRRALEDNDVVVCAL